MRNETLSAGVGRSSTCGPLVGALTRLRREAGDAAHIVNGTRMCHAVFIGDSHTQQAVDAAWCELRGRLQLNSSYHARHPGFRPEYAQVARDIRLSTDAAIFRGGNSSASTPRLPYEGYIYEPLWLQDDEKDRWAVQLSFVGRNRRAPAGAVDVFDPPVFEGIVGRLGGCKLVVYGEGMHYHAAYQEGDREGGPEVAAFASNVGFALDSMEGAARRARRGSAFTVWEVVAQHFSTPQGDGLFEHTAVYQARRHGMVAASEAAADRARAPPPAAEGSLSTEILKAHATATRAPLDHPTSACADTLANASDWRNAVLSAEAARRPRVHLLPFYAASRAWGRTLHIFKDDCSHVCYDPYYFLPLWGELERAAWRGAHSWHGSVQSWLFGRARER